MVNEIKKEIEPSINTVIYKNKKKVITKILCKCFIYLMLLLMYAPILYLMVFSLTDSNVIGSWTGFSFESYIRLFASNNVKSQEIWQAVGNTILVAFCSALISTILGIMGAIGMFYSRKRIRNTLDFITQIPVVNAEIVIALSLTILFVFCNFEFSFFTLLIGHIVLSLPFVVLSIQPKLKQMDPNLYEAALDLGATQREALFKVVIPEIFPGIVSGFMLSITLSLDDFIITAFTKPSTGFDTISTYVEAATKKTGLPIQLRALTTLIFVGVLIVMIIYNFKVNKTSKASIKGGSI